MWWEVMGKGKHSVFPHNFVWGSCFWFCIPGASSSSRLLPPPPLIIFSHTTLSHTIFHTQSFHHLSHTTWSHTTLSPLRCRRGTISHPPSFCVAGVAQSHIHLRFAWQAWHSWHSEAHFDWLSRPWRPWRRGTLRGRRGTISHPRWFCVASVVQSHIHLRFAWQAWHPWHSVTRLDLV